ncbi:MAG: caspase family protein [Candidatus Marinimicrobia bacterium]|nr:caspase family protein [Candidatus Neomarinimicrobiota bacterium]
MKKILIIYVYSVLSILYASSLEFYQNSYAVIIGINNYNSDNVKDLGYAVEDAESIANLLIGKLGYKEDNIHLLLDENATQINIKNKLYQIAMEAGENDRILVFYGGHGETIPLPSGGEVGYLLPVDGDPDNLFATGLSMQEFKQISEMTPAKHVLYLVDVCYGGIMTVGTRSLAKNKFSDDEKYLKKITTESARQIITAGGKGDKAQERAIWGHSAFTKEFLSGIEDGLADSDQDGYITSNELGIYLSKKVYITSEENQTPVNGRYGSGEGEFVFVNPAYIEEIVEEKIDDALSSTPVNNIDDSRTQLQLSEIQNTLSFMNRLTSSNKSSISNFDNEDTYLDSSFVGPFLKIQFEENMKPGDTQTEVQLLFKKYIHQYYDYKNFRLSSYLYPLSPSFTHNRVSGYTMGPYFSTTQLKPLAIQIEYWPIYSLSLKQFYHYATFKRHPWGKKNQEFNLTYYDNISSNDSWMRGNINKISSMFYGKDYKDYFHKKGLSIDYTHRFNDNLALRTKYSNTNQKFLPTILNYKNKLFKKRILENRENFQTAPTPFEDGRHVTIQTVFSLNHLNKKMMNEFTYTLTLTDTIQSFENMVAPKVYLISESKGWSAKQYEMNLEDSTETIETLGGIVEISFTNSTDSSHLQGDSLFTMEYTYDIHIPLPPGSHAYRFLIDSTRYEIDDENEERVIDTDGILKTVSIVNVEKPYRFDIGYEYADKSLGSDFSYERLTFNYSLIRTLSSEDALAFRLMGGFSKKQLPIQKLFYVGGEGSVRGFDYMDTKKFSGNQMVLAKIEYHFFTLPFIFYDVAVIGNRFDFNHPIHSYGFGFSEDDFRDSPSNFTFILYRNAESNNGNWGVEFMWNYFFDQLGEPDIDLILP